VRLLLEAYYDVQFSDRSHGFRPGRGCHTALSEVVETWKGTHWFIEGDISDCFGGLDHDVMLSILSEKIHDGRFLRLISHMLKAGYLEDWRWHATLSGAPQGGVASPILSNIYLDRLDRFIEQSLLPDYNQGQRRRPNRAYRVIEYAIAKATRHGDRDAVRALRRQRRCLSSQDPNDPRYRRYVRYADDCVPRTRLEVAR
jgi:retron-type reverse transcriptase